MLKIEAFNGEKILTKMLINMLSELKILNCIYKTLNWRISMMTNENFWKISKTSSGFKFNFQCLWKKKF